MSVVLARRFGKRIVVLSDTMISDREAVAPNIFPGRLKSIVVNKWLTVSYAGLSSQAMAAVRSMRKWSAPTTSDAISILLDANKQYNDAIDFILCSHEAGARLIKISGSVVSEGNDFYWIGNSVAATEISKLRVQHPIAENLPDYISQEELNFANTFWNYLKGGEGIRHGVGGAAINCLCSEFGHWYQSQAGVFSWDTIIIGQDDPRARVMLNKTGMYHFGYNVCAPAKRGQAVVGLYFDQSGTGYVYDPMHYDNAMKVASTSVTDLSRLVSDAAIVLSRAIADGYNA